MNTPVGNLLAALCLILPVFGYYYYVIMYYYCYLCMLGLFTLQSLLIALHGKNFTQSTEKFPVIAPNLPVIPGGSGAGKTID